ncbi:MAG: lipase maturation factor family protein [Elusimicrobia bacterium]|nr:lipase maturation factor family protein [Elusimicrobiota bacterium]
MSKSRPVLVFDGDCGFCRLWIRRWKQTTGERVEYVPSQEARVRFPRLDPAALNEAVHLIETDGTVRRGAEAVFRTLDAGGGAGRVWLRLHRAVPPFRAASEAAYRLVAARRPLFSRLTRLLWGSPERAPIAGTVRAVLAGLGLCYLVAFVSLAVQVRGLIGADGLMPAVQLLAAGRAYGLVRFWEVPSLVWLFHSDAALVGLCAAGALSAAALILDFLPGPAVLLCWALYLSLCAVGSDFLSYQWDALLLEAGLIAVFLAPWSLRRRDRAEPSRGALLLLRLLLFKVILQSGLVKILSGDPHWRDLTALTYHYWTQPLPNPVAWWMSLLPVWFQKLSCLGALGVELGAPWLLLLPRRPRRLGAAAIAALMILIALTGNYGFFNLLTLVLCLAALDDDLPWLARLAPKASPRPARPARARAVGAFAALWLFVGGLQWSLQLGARPPLAPVWGTVLAALEPLRSIDSYGLFAVMTTKREEISVEVSADGRDWREWPFRWKPGDPRRAPPETGPYMPRLDWQMWFAGLGAPSPWFGNLLYRLLQGSPSVEALMGPSPLGRTKPLYARAWLWSTRFSTPAQRRASGDWWRREREGLYFPVVSLKGGKPSP